MKTIKVPWTLWVSLALLLTTVIAVWLPFPFGLFIGLAMVDAGWLGWFCGYCTGKRVGFLIGSAAGTHAFNAAMEFIDRKKEEHRQQADWWKEDK